MLNCSNSRIESNDNIHAKEYGIIATQSNLVIYDNSINISGFANTASGGIQLNGGYECQVINNIVYAKQCSFGIESNNGLDNSITNNDITVFSTISTRIAAVRLMGSMSDIVSQNVAEGIGHASGIIAQNAPNNTYDCNDINTVYDGIAILNNSLGQTIQGNDILTSNIDLTIRSVTGVQSHRGNRFYNGSTRAVLSSYLDYYQSLFLVNQNFPYHMPSDPDPGDDIWFERENHVQNYYTCSGEPGTGTIYTEEQSLCDYFNRIKPLKDSLPQVFSVKLFHLLRYERTQEGYTLPDCIKLDSILLESCGLTQLADATTMLSKMQENSPLFIEKIQHIRTLQKDYTTTDDEILKATIWEELNQKINSSKDVMKMEQLADSLSYDNIKREFEAIDCTDILVQKWKDIYIKYIEFIQVGEITKEDERLLSLYSQECSDRYGDAIHLARVMSGTYSDTYYDVYDNCMDGNEFKLGSSGSNSLKAYVQPNPTTGIIELHTDARVSGTIKILDITGRVLVTEDIVDAKVHIIDLNMNAGVYFIHFTTDKDIKYVEKIVLTN